MSFSNRYVGKSVEDSSEWIFKIVFFIIYPFGAFLLSLRNAASKSSYLIFFLFGVVFCWHMNPVDLMRYDDLRGIMERVVSTNLTWNDVCKQIVAYLTMADDSPKELYENILIFISKSFSRNPHLFFALAAIPYLIFMLNSLKQITSDRKFREGSVYCLIVLALFVFPRDIITVQNPRFTTGVWLIIYALIQFYKQPRFSLKYYVLILMAPFIHSGFWPFVFLFTVGLYVSKFPKISLWLLYLSIPFSYLSYELLSTVDFSILPSSMAVWVENYMSEDKYAAYVMNEGASGFYWVAQGMTAFRNTAYLLIPIYLWKQRDKINERLDLNRFFQFYLYLYAVVNFIQFVPVVGERYYWIVQILSIFFWFKVIYPKHNKILLLILFSCSYHILRRYVYGGAVASSVPLEIFYTPLPNLIADFWGVS